MLLSKLVVFRVITLRDFEEFVCIDSEETF